MGFRNMVSNRIRERLDTVDTILTNDNILCIGLGKHNYPIPTLDPRNSNSEALDRFNNVVDDICQETITRLQHYLPDLLSQYHYPEKR